MRYHAPQPSPVLLAEGVDGLSRTSELRPSSGRMRGSCRCSRATCTRGRSTRTRSSVDGAARQARAHVGLVPGDGADRRADGRGLRRRGSPRDACCCSAVKPARSCSPSRSWPRHRCVARLPKRGDGCSGRAHAAGRSSCTRSRRPVRSRSRDGRRLVRRRRRGRVRRLAGRLARVAGRAACTPHGRRHRHGRGAAAAAALLLLPGRARPARRGGPLRADAARRRRAGGRGGRRQGYARGSIDAGSLAAARNGRFRPARAGARHRSPLRSAPYGFCSRGYAGSARVGRRGPLPLRLAAVSLARNPGQATVVATFLVASLGLALFAVTYRATLLHGQHDEAYYAVPAPYVATEDLSQLVPVLHGWAKHSGDTGASPHRQRPGAAGFTFLGVPDRPARASAERVPFDAAATRDRLPVCPCQRRRRRLGARCVPFAARRLPVGDARHDAQRPAASSFTAAFRSRARRSARSSSTC